MSDAVALACLAIILTMLARAGEWALVALALSAFALGAVAVWVAT